VPDLLIRGLSKAAITALDQAAKRAGLSRNEYLRRDLETAGAREKDAPVSVADLIRSGAAVADLLDAEVMGQAWR
jgi:hypothetical protein